MRNNLLKNERLSTVLHMFHALTLLNKFRFLLLTVLSLFFKLTRKHLIRQLRLEVDQIAYNVKIGLGEWKIIYENNVLCQYMALAEFRPKAGNICIDIGANIVATSLGWWRTSPHLKIIAVEPHPLTFKRLKRNIELNNAGQIIKPSMVAIGKKDGILTMQISDEGTMAMRPDTYQTGAKEITVPSLSLDSFIANEAIDRIDLLKIDIEGFEVEALLGATEAMKQTRRLVIEFHSNLLRDKCLLILKDSGFDQITEMGSLLFCTRPDDHLM